MDPTENLSARVLLRNILSTEPPRTPISRSVSQGVSTSRTSRSSRLSNKDAGAQTPQDILRRSLKHKISESITRKSEPAPKRRTASFVLRKAKTPASASMLFDDGETPRHILRNILQTEPVKSPVVHEKGPSEELEQPSAASSSSRTRPSIELSGLDLPDVTIGNVVSTLKGLSRKRPRRSLNVTAFEKRLRDGEDAEEKSEESGSDLSSSSLSSSTSLSLKTPFVDVRTEKRGLQRRVSNRRKITEEEFGAAVNKRQIGGKSSFVSRERDLSETAYSEGFTMGLSKLGEPDITADIVNCNTALYAQPDAMTSNFSIAATQDKATVMASQFQRERKSISVFPCEEGVVAELRNDQCLSESQSQEDVDRAQSQIEERVRSAQPEDAVISKSEEEEGAAESQTQSEEEANGVEVQTEDEHAADSQPEEDVETGSGSVEKEIAPDSQTEEEEGAAKSHQEGASDSVSQEDTEAGFYFQEDDNVAESQNEEEGATKHQSEDGASDSQSQEEAEAAFQSGEHKDVAESQNEEEDAADSQSQDDAEAGSQFEEDEDVAQSQTEEEDAEAGSRSEEDENIAEAGSRSEEDENIAESQNEEEDAADSQSQDDAEAGSQSGEHEDVAESQNEEEAAADSQSQEEAEAAFQSGEHKDVAESQNEEEDAADSQSQDDAEAGSQFEEDEDVAQSQTEEEDAEAGSRSEEDENIAEAGSRSEEDENIAESQNEEEDAADSQSQDDAEAGSRSEEDEVVAESQNKDHYNGQIEEEEEEQLQRDLEHISRRTHRSGGALIVPIPEAGKDLFDATAAEGPDAKSKAHSNLEVEEHENSQPHDGKPDLFKSSNQGQTDASCAENEADADKENFHFPEVSDQLSETAPERAAPQNAAEQEEEWDDDKYEELPSKTPAFVREKRIFIHPDPSASPVFKNSGTNEALPAAKPKLVRERRKRPAKKKGALPKSYLMSVFKHFAQTKVSADVYPVLNEIMDKFFDRLAVDLEAYAAHAKRKTIEVEDAVLLLKRQGYVNDKVPVEVLIEKYLRMDQRKLLIPIATSGNVVIPNKRR